MKKDHLRHEFHETVNVINAIAVISSANAFSIKDKHDKKEPLASFRQHIFIEAGKVGAHVIKLEKLLDKYLEHKPKSGGMPALKKEWDAVIIGIKKNLRHILDSGKNSGQEVDAQKLSNTFMCIAEDAKRLAEVAGEMRMV